MKKLLVLSYLCLTWFVCIGQTKEYFQIVSYTTGKETLFQFNQDGIFAMDNDLDYYQEELCADQILHTDEGVELSLNGYTIRLVTSDCRWIKQVLMVHKGIVVCQETFKTLVTRD